MKRSSTIVLQIFIIAIGIAVLAFMLWEPQAEGVNAHSTLFEIYFKDPFLAYAYIGSIPFFAALYQALKLLGYAGQNKIFSQLAVNALRTIKYCGSILVGFIVVGEVIIMFNNSDDRAGGVFMGLLAILASGVIAIAAGVFEKHLKTAVDMKSENDLTV